MTTEDTELGRLLLLGKNYGEYGSVASVAVGTRAAAAISVGSDPQSPSQQFKTDRKIPNEDALCVIEAGSWAGFGVADADYGPESSHMLMSRLHNIWAKIEPTSIDHLGQMIEFLRNGEMPRSDSECTLLIAAYNRSSRTGYGISFGDSTFVIVGPSRTPIAINERDGRFVTVANRASMLNGAPFWFQAEPGDMLLMFTDGVDECHYRQPATSIRPDHIAQTLAESDGSPLAVVDALSALVLRGVDGNPGGQDNVAIIAALA